MPPAADPQLARLAYSPSEVGAALGLDAETVRQLIVAGRLHAVDVSRPGTSRARYVIPAEALDAFLASQADGVCQLRGDTP